MKRKPRGLATWTPEQRLWRNVIKTDTCWLWLGSKTTAGYGHMHINGTATYVHRLSFEIHHRHLVAGEVVCHSCDVRNCVNPEHLFAGSIADNNRDMWNKGRGRGLDPYNGKLTTDQRREAVMRVLQGETKTAVASDFGVTRQAINHLVKAGIYG